MYVIAQRADHPEIFFSPYLWRLSPDLVGLPERLLLRVPAVPEPRAEAEGRPVERRAHLDEAEEGVVLDAALPQVLAGLPRRRLEPVRALVVLAAAGNTNDDYF